MGGVYFEPGLTRREHIRYVMDKNVINVMRYLAGMEWGADFSSHTNMYVALISLRLDYRSIVYGSAATSVLAELDIIRRVCLINYWIHLRGHGDIPPTKRVLQTYWKKERTQKTSFD